MFPYVLHHDSDLIMKYLRLVTCYSILRFPSHFDPTEHLEPVIPECFSWFSQLCEQATSPTWMGLGHPATFKKNCLGTERGRSKSMQKYNNRYIIVAVWKKTCPMLVFPTAKFLKNI